MPVWLVLHADGHGIDVRFCPTVTGLVTITIYNLSGQPITKFFDQGLPGKTGSLTWEEMVPGIYILKLEQKRYSYSGKFILY